VFHLTNTAPFCPVEPAPLISISHGSPYSRTPTYRRYRLLFTTPELFWYRPLYDRFASFPSLNSLSWTNLSVSLLITGLARSLSRLILSCPCFPWSHRYRP